LQYFGYTQPEHIPDQERANLAFNMVIAALSSKKIFDFDKLVSNFFVVTYIFKDEPFNYTITIIQPRMVDRNPNYVSHERHKPMG
jgi:hypothetical protein